MCQCQYNARGFLEIECFECVEDATEVAHRAEQSIERGFVNPCGDDDCEECNGAARFEGIVRDGGTEDGYAIYSNVSI